MVSYNIEAMIRWFDTRADTATTGSLSSFLGEVIVLEALCHWLAAEGHAVTVVPGRPARDDSAFGAVCRKPSFRYLDAWLLLDDEHLAAVECKHWTAASADSRQQAVPVDPASLAAYARDQWTQLAAEHLDHNGWTSVNKVFLPLRPPASLDPAFAAHAMARLQRILAIWRPISRDGTGFRSEAESTSVEDDQVIRVTAEVFSASLYVRQLRASGATHLPACLGRTEKLRQALDELTAP
jgi:hypothetical protein